MTDHHHDHEPSITVDPDVYARVAAAAEAPHRNAYAFRPLDELDRALRRAFDRFGRARDAVDLIAGQPLANVLADVETTLGRGLYDLMEQARAADAPAREALVAELNDAHAANRGLRQTIAELEHRIEAGPWPQDEPLLGLATTRELLFELEARLRSGHAGASDVRVAGAAAPADLILDVLDALDAQARPALDYRTVDADG